MAWTVTLHRKATKAVPLLSETSRRKLIALLRELEEYGPIRGNWPNFSDLEKKRYHCHIKKGKPTIVVVWEVKNIEIRIIEVIYVGTHEKSPY